MTQQRTRPFHLHQGNSNLTRSDGTASTWVDIWKYQVPRGTTLMIAPGDTFSAYLEDASAEVGNHTAKIEVVVRDPAERENTLVLGPVHYLSVKEFQDDDLIYRIGLLSHIEVPPRYWVVVRVYDDGAIDESDSQFNLYVHESFAGL